MSSTIAKIKKNVLDKILIAFHKKASHYRRVEILSKAFVEIILSLNLKNGSIKCLDIGCGDMTIAKNMVKMLPGLSIHGIDIYPNIKNWENYSQFDGKEIPFESNTYDIVLFSDVLHHDFKNIEILLKEAKRVSNYILIKDHFEYGLVSRKLLQLADIIGNYGYGVSIPDKYFTINSYSKTLKRLELKEVHHVCPVNLYDHNPIVKAFFKGKFQFISVVR